MERAQLPGAELPAHQELGTWLDAPWSWEAEFEADLTQLILRLAAAPGEGAGPPVPGGGARA